MDERPRKGYGGPRKDEGKQRRNIINKEGKTKERQRMNERTRKGKGGLRKGHGRARERIRGGTRQ